MSVVRYVKTNLSELQRWLNRLPRKLRVAVLVSQYLALSAAVFSWFV